MTDPLDPTDVASAYLDGRLDASERAAAESDGAVMAEVEELRHVQALLSDVEPAPISRREEQFAAALGVWDRLPEAERMGTARESRPDGVDALAAAGAGAVTKTDRAKSERWFRSPRLLGAAAAAIVVVGGLAVVVRQDPASDDSGDPQLAEEAPAEGEALEAESAGDSAEESADASADAAEASSDDDGGTDDSGTIDSIEASSPPARDLAADDLEAEVEVLEEAADEGVDVSNATPSAGVDDLGPPTEVDTSELTLIDNDEDLADFASLAAIAPESETDSTTPFEECPGLGIDVVVGPAAYVGYGPVVVGVDQSRGVAIAYDAGTCGVVATASLP